MLARWPLLLVSLAGALAHPQYYTQQYANSCTSQPTTGYAAHSAVVTDT